MDFSGILPRKAHVSQLLCCLLRSVSASAVNQDAVCIAFIVSEAISITENAGLMGVPVPKKLIQAIELLQKKEEQDHADKD